MEREKQIACGQLPAESREQIVRYLLDDLDQTERAHLEEAMVRTPALFDEIASVEDDLILKYLRGDLDSRSLLQFVEVYMHSPAKRARVESAHVLREAILNAAKTRKVIFRRPYITAAVSAAALVVLFALLWPLWRTLPRQAQPPGSISRISFTLEPGLTRSADGLRLAVPSGIHEVDFELTLPQVAPRGGYRAILGTPERPAAWKGAAVTKGRGLLITVPADVLSPGDYTLELQVPGEYVATYYFRVAK